jgi:hypothetical protein
MEDAQALKGLSESPDFSDVTLAHCKHHQNGFCKFGERCRRRHINESCPQQDCKSKACLKRHPKLCKFFATFNSCKFGENCAYKHITSSKQHTIDNLLVKTASLENAVKEMTDRIESLEKVIENLTKETKSSVPCNQCNYKASSEVVLKRHITIKHKELEVETLRFSGPGEDSRRLSPEKDTPRAAEEIECATNLPFKCEVCDHEAASMLALKGHMNIKHDPNIPHTSEWLPNTCHICSQSFTQTKPFKLHMIFHHGCSEDCYECSQCGMPSDLGIYWLHNQTIIISCKACFALESDS